MSLIILSEASFYRGEVKAPRSETKKGAPTSQGKSRPDDLSDTSLSPALL